jgi:hypothetical protein
MAQPAKPCGVCAGPRPPGSRTSRLVAGRRVLVCRGCKGTVYPRGPDRKPCALCSASREGPAHPPFVKRKGKVIPACASCRSPAPRIRGPDTAPRKLPPLQSEAGRRLLALAHRRLSA